MSCRLPNHPVERIQTQWPLSLCCTPPPIVEQLQQLLHQISDRVGHFLERRGILERDKDNSSLRLDGLEEDPIQDIHGHSVTYRVAVGPQKGRKVFTLQTIPPQPEPTSGNSLVAELNGFSLHAGVAARTRQQRKLERLILWGFRLKLY